MQGTWSGRRVVGVDEAMIVINGAMVSTVRAGEGAVGVRRLGRLLCITIGDPSDLPCANGRLLLR